MIKAAPSPWLYGAVGLLQGTALWALHYTAAQDSWFAVLGPWLTGLVYLSLALPMAWYLSQDGFGSAIKRLQFSVVMGVFFTLLGAHAGVAWETQGLWPPLPGHLLAAAVLGFVLVPLAAGFDSSRKRFDYAKLFELAWRNAVLLPVGVVLTGILWVLLWAGAWLMGTIGLRGLRELLLQPSSMYIITGGCFGLAVGLALAKADTLLAFRRFWLSLTTWFLPLALAFAVVWVCALPFTGLQSFFATRHAASYLFWFCLLTVTFANSAFQDGIEPPAFPAWLASSLSWAWLALPLLALIADWALWQRVTQYGWTPDRIWAALVGLLVTGHAVGYACSVFMRPQWMASLPATNITMTLLKVVFITALISPLADVRQIAVNSQVARLQAGIVSPDLFDWQFLHQSGPYGKAALKTLAAAIDTDPLTKKITQRAAEEMRIESELSAPARQDVQAALSALRERIVVLPRAAAPEASLLEWLARADADWDERTCLSTPKNCSLWIVDADQDGQNEAVLLWETSGSVRATLYAREETEWRKQGSLRGGPRLLSEWAQFINDGQVGHVAPRWSDLLVNGERVRLER